MSPLSSLASLFRCLAPRTRPQPRALARFCHLAPLRPAPPPAPLLLPWRQRNGSACYPSILWFATSRCWCYGRVGVVCVLVRCCCDICTNDVHANDCSRCVMACKYSSLGTPRGRYDEHSSKSSLSCETKVYRTSRRKPNFRRWCLLASWHFGQWRQEYCWCVFT
jgi:hypothetical protein